MIVFGDHGEAFGEHPGNFAHTMFIHEENVRVPYVIAAPGADQRSSAAFSASPAPSTPRRRFSICWGCRPSALHQGTSLLGPEPRMALFFTDYSIGWLGLADGCWKYLFEMDAGRSRLFDVCADPRRVARSRGGVPRARVRVPGAGSRLGRRSEGRPCARSRRGLNKGETPESMTKRTDRARRSRVRSLAGSRVAQPLSQPERDSLVKHLEQTRQAFLTSVSGLVGCPMDVQGGTGSLVDRRGGRTHRDQRNHHPAAGDGSGDEGARRLPRIPNPFPTEASLAGLLDRTEQVLRRPKCSSRPTAGHSRTRSSRISWLRATRRPRT